MQWPLHDCTLTFVWREMIVVLGHYNCLLTGNDRWMIVQEQLGGGKWLLCDAIKI